jgi:hypothetical protein
MNEIRKTIEEASNKTCQADETNKNSEIMLYIEDKVQFDVIIKSISMQNEFIETLIKEK